MARILTVIPARAGSKGLPGKNLRRLAGRSLVGHAIATMRACAIESRVIVSTESPEIARVAEAEGAEVPFIRPPELAEDEVSLIPVARHAMKFFDEQGWPPDLVLSLQPSAPLLEPRSVESALRRMLDDTTVDSVVSATMIRHCHPFRAYRLGDGERLAPLTEYTSEKYLQKQDRPAAYGFTGGFYLRRRRLLEADAGQGFDLGTEIGAQIVGEEEAIDIESEVDFMLAEAILRRRGQTAQAGGGASSVHGTAQVQQ